MTVGAGSGGSRTAPSWLALIGGSGTVYAASWNSKGSLLAVGDGDALTLWNTEGLPDPPRLIEKRTANISYSVRFSRRGLLAASDRDEIAIYE